MSSIYGAGVRGAVEFEKAQASLQKTLGQDAADLVALLARISVWDWWTARDSVVACFDRGMALQQAKEMCEYSLKSRIPVATVLRITDALR